MNNPEIFASSEAFHAKLNEMSGEIVPASETPMPVDVVSAISAQPLEQEVQPLNHEPQSVDQATDSGEHDNGNESYNEPSNDFQELTNTKNSHMIPKSRLDKELEKSRNFESQLQNEREARIRLETQLQMYNEMNKPAQLPEPQLDPLDPDTFNYTNQRLSKLEQQLQTGFKELESRTNHMNQVSMLNAQEQSFIRNNPDYLQAIEYVKNIETSIAKNLTNDETMQQQMVYNKLQAATQIAMQSGQDVPSVMYRMAQTYGYKNDSARAPEVPSQHGKPNIENLARNMSKTANVAHLGNQANTQLIPTDIRSALNKTGNEKSGINPDTFHEILKKHQALDNRY